MASQHLFTLVVNNFNAVVAAGAGTVSQWTYTVPAGKTAILATCLARVADNANAVETSFSDILVNGVAIIREVNDGAGNNTLTPVISMAPRVRLNEGDTVVGRTTNTGAAGVVMQVAAVVEEYG
jgi:Ca2+-binding RTX toxin-like protein